MQAESKIVPIDVYAELTPNPNSMKFVTNKMLLANGTAEYLTKAEATNSPLALQLFDFTGVKKVFITSNFVTITKEDNVDWYDVTNIFREFIRGFFMAGEKVFTTSPFEVNQSNLTSHDAQTTVNTSAETDPETAEKIKQLLDEYVRPAVEGDGGAIHFQSYINGTVNVVLKGACSGCPSSVVTLKAGIETLLKQMIPGIKEVVAVNG